MAQESKTLNEAISSLKPFIERTSVVRSPMDNLFLSCLKASFVSTFEFVDIALREETRSAPFLTPALRRSVEDIIYFHFLSQRPERMREKIIEDMVALEFANSLEHQDSFFRRFRPFQPTVKSKPNINEIKDNVCSFWRNNGWPRWNKPAHPPVVEIARKSDLRLLDFVYDFIYRFTSGTVHFTPRILLRSCWGGESLKETLVNSRSMDIYYARINQVYGSLLLCLYFELFPEFLKPRQKEKVIVKKIRKYLCSVRWPEMITFEEMNNAVPKAQNESGFLWELEYRAYSNKITESGFISGADEARWVMARVCALTGAGDFRDFL